MIANAGSLGLDWRMLDLSAYLEAMEAHAAAHEGVKREADPDSLAKVMASRLSAS